MVIFRFVWGFGAAGPRSLSMAMVRDTCEGDMMARTMSLVMATYMVVPVLAPSLGALLLKVAPWRIVFWVPIISALVLMGIVSTMAETLPVGRRRSIGLKALADAAGAVVRSRVTVGYGLATLFLFGIMSSYVGGSEAMINEVFHRAALFPIVFGAVGLGIAATSLLSARLVPRLGLRRVVQLGAVSLLASTSLLFAFAHLAGDSPPLWLFMVIVGLMMPSVAALVPNCNTAAMVPLPHVAGMAAAILGTAATAGGAVLGAVIDGAFDGSIRPFATGVLALGILATASMLLVAQRTPVPIRIPVAQP